MNSLVYEHKDLTIHGVWLPPYIGPWNSNVRSLCLCGLWGPLASGASSSSG